MPEAAAGAELDEERANPVKRALALGALALAVLFVAVLLLRGGGTHSYALVFQNAGQLVKGDDVQVGGRRVGKVKSIALTDNEQARITVAVENGFAPLHEGTTALIRATSLSGIANRYIALQPGPNNRPKLEDGATLGTDRTTSPVDLDQVFNALDEKTRTDLQNVVQGSATALAGKDRARLANITAHYLDPALSATARLVGEAVRDQRAFSDFIRSSSRVVTTVAARRNSLANLVSDANTTNQAIGSENVALARALGVLPGTLRQGTATFSHLRSTLDSLDVLVSASKPATKRLAPFLADLRPLVADARPTIADLRRLVTRKGPDNDLVDLLKRAPALEAVARPSLEHSRAAAAKALPVLSFIRPYAPELVGWLRDFGQGASNYDANGHFARIQPIFNAFSVASNPAGEVLTPITSGGRLDGLNTGQTKRCPGAASQPNEDKSGPYHPPGLDCDPSQVPPGP